MFEIFTVIFSVYVIHTFAWFTPWPLFVLVLRNSLSYWFKAWCLNGVWIAIWNLIHMGYAILWLLLISWLSENILFYIKYIWAWYLTYLGVKIIASSHKSKRKAIEREDTENSYLALILQGFLVNITSPKASIFFVTIFTILVSKINNIYILIWVVFLLSLNSLFMAGVLSYLFSRDRVIKLYDRHLFVINIILWVSMLLFASLVLIYE